MNQTSDRRLLAVWIGLVMITALSWLTGSSSEATPMQLNTGVTIVVLVISALKARFILREFMEVHHASRTLRRITDAWVTFTLLLLMATYCFGADFWRWMEQYLHLLP